LKLAKRLWYHQPETPGKPASWWKYPLSLLCLVPFLAGTVLPVYGCLLNATMPLVIGSCLWIGALFGGRYQRVAAL
jgi:hypothetical protein